jgi:hypothetical protein
MSGIVNFSGAKRPDRGVTGIRPYKNGPRNGSNAAPGMSHLLNPTLSASTVSMDTNVTTSLPLMVRPWSEKYEAKFKAGSILFVLAGNSHQRLSTAVDVCVLNYFLEEAHTIMETAGKNSRNTELYQKIEHVKGFKYNLFGVVRNDLLADSSLTKLYNCDVFGRAVVANIWGPTKRTDVLGLALVTMDVNLVYAEHRRPNGTILPAAVTENECLQVVGTRNGILCPYGEFSEEYQVGGNQKRRKNNVGSAGKKAIKAIHSHYHLGTVVHCVSRIPSDNIILKALRFQDEMILLPRIEILMS